MHSTGLKPVGAARRHRAAATTSTRTIAHEHRRVRSAALTGVGQLIGLLGSTLIGVLVAGTLPPNPRVDAFFAANQVYALALYLGQAVRITAPALLLRSGLEAKALHRAVTWLAVGTMVFMVIAAILGAPLLTAPARSAFTRDLLILAPAAAVHVYAGSIAARLAVVGSFGWSAMAYAGGSVTSGILLALAIGGAGAEALAPCIAFGGFAIGIVMALAYRRVLGGVDEADAAAPIGRPVARPAPSAAFAARRIGLGATPALSMQALITVVIVVAGHILSGGTALLSYAFLALFAFTTIAITPMSIVLGPEVAERWDGRTSTLVEIIGKATRLAVVVAVPLISLGFLVGRPFCDLVLGALTEQDLSQVFGMLAVLCPSLLFTAAATAATVGITSADRLDRLAVVLGGLTVLTVLVGVGLVLWAPSLLVVAGAASMLVVTAGIMTIAVAVGPRRVPGILVTVIGDNLPIILPSVAVTALLAPFATQNLLVGCALSLVALAVHLAVVLLTRRDTVLMLAGAARARKQVA